MSGWEGCREEEPGRRGLERLGRRCPAAPSARRGQVPASGGRGFRKSLRPPRLRPDPPPARRRARAQRIRVHPLPARPWGPARTRSHVVRAVPLPAPRAPSRVGRPPPPWPVAPAAVIQQDCAPTVTAGARRPGCAVSHGAGRPAAALPTEAEGLRGALPGALWTPLGCGTNTCCGRAPAGARSFSLSFVLFLFLSLPWERKMLESRRKGVWRFSGALLLCRRLFRSLFTFK